MEAPVRPFRRILFFRGRSTKAGLALHAHRTFRHVAVWNVRYDRTPGLLQLYIDAMRNASFASTSTVYVASGLLFNGTSPGGCTPALQQQRATSNVARRSAAKLHCRAAGC
mgnify:CR=1 FL=1